MADSRIKNKVMKNEGEFKKWFMKNYAKLGYSQIIRKDIGKFPDFIMLKNGKRMNVELETTASNFLAHKHPIDNVDEVVCILKDCELKKPIIVAEDLEFEVIPRNSMNHMNPLFSVCFWAFPTHSDRLLLLIVDVDEDEVRARRVVGGLGRDNARARRPDRPEDSFHGLASHL